jgi:hypothetical protein
MFVQTAYRAELGAGILAAMPLTGQWERTQTPLRVLSAREKRIVYAVAAIATACLAIGLVLIAFQGADPPAKPGCIDAVVPGIMGGGHVEPCGAKATAMCRSQVGHDDNYARPILASCRAQGFLPPG